jgi:putative ABC transport system permease protein
MKEHEMSWLNMWAKRFAGLFLRDRAEKEMREEMQAHVEMQTEENQRIGMAPEEARRAALRSFGGIEQAKEACRDQAGFPFLETLFQDLHYGLRMLAKNPGFTAVAVLTLALGIGANSTIFSVVNAALIHPLPFRDSDRLVTQWGTLPEIGYSGPMWLCDRGYKAWRDQNRVFAQIGAYGVWMPTLTGGGDPVRLTGAQITASLFPMLGTHPAKGRNFLSEEEQPGHGFEVMLSDELWRERFHSDPVVVGKSVTLSGKPFTVVGIMPAGFGFPNEAEFWTPIELTNQCSNSTLMVVARLKSDGTLEKARAEVAVISKRLHPDQGLGGKNRMTLEPLAKVMGENLQPVLMVLLAAVGLVLLIACANVANLLLARASGRQREIAIRNALGASRTRIVFQLLTESLSLALLGGAAGLLVAVWGHTLLAASIALLPQSLGSPSVMARIASVGVDRWVLGFTSIVSILTGMVFGLAPAIQASKPDLIETLKESGRTASSGLGRGRLRNLLVAGEMAISVILLVGAGLLIHSLSKLLNVDPGFAPENVLAMNVNLPPSRYQSAAQMNAFEQRTIQKLSDSPGVRTAGEVFGLPMSDAIIRGDVTLEGKPAPPNVFPNKVIVAGDYFRALGIPLLQGRLFNSTDTAGTPTVAIVSAGMAKRFWPGENVIGRRLRPGFPNDSWCTVVGVVGDVKSGGLDDKSSLALYLPYEQAPSPFLTRDLTYVVRTATDPLAAIPALTKSIQSVDPELPVFDVATMEQLIHRSVSEPRFNAFLLGIFAALALGLSGVGIYGVMSFAVNQRTREIGVRVALGAGRQDVVRLVFDKGMRLALAGIAVGLAGAFALTRFLSSFLFAVPPDDPATFATVSALLIVVALVACYIPARRAMNVDPLVALRYE